MKCYKCKKEMYKTPVCIDCGILPIAEPTFEEKDQRISELEEELDKYKVEVSRLGGLVKAQNEALSAAIDRAEKAEDEVERFSIWRWSENSEDGSHYNSSLDRIAKAVGLSGSGEDWLRLRQALATAMYNELERDSAD